MLFIIFIVFYVVFSWVVANLGRKNGMSFGLVFGISLLFTPLIGLLIVFLKTNSRPPEVSDADLGSGVFDTAEKHAAYFRKRAELEQQIANLERQKSMGSDINHDNEISNLRSQLNNLRF